MTRPGTGSSQWAMVDEGWGRKAVEFATLSEPGNSREYVVVHHRLGVGAGDRLLDVACGSGLAIELARLRGATPADIQALRDAGFGDGRIFAITAFVALRLAFSTINDSLGAQPDAALAQSRPREVREAVTYGRAVSQASAI